MQTTSKGIPIPDATPEAGSVLLLQIAAMAAALNGLFATVGIQSVDVVDTSAVLAALSDLEVSVKNGKSYMVRIVLRVSDTGPEGIQVDLNGGSATVADFWATFEIKDLSFGRVVHTAALATVASMDSFAGGKGLVTIECSFVATSNGTFAPRAAQAAHTSGSLTVLKGSSISLQEVA